MLRGVVANAAPGELLGPVEPLPSVSISSSCLPLNSPQGLVPMSDPHSRSTSPLPGDGLSSRQASVEDGAEADNNQLSVHGNNTNTSNSSGNTSSNNNNRSGRSSKSSTLSSVLSLRNAEASPPVSPSASSSLSHTFTLGAGTGAGAATSPSKTDEAMKLAVTGGAHARASATTTTGGPNAAGSTVSSSLAVPSESGGENENGIVAVFVVSFDPRKGNTVEWRHPPNIELPGVEFKAMPSGSHLVEEDFAYFSMGNQFGLSCFKQIKVDSTHERNTRARSVGIISRHYSPLQQYRDILRSQVRLELTGNSTDRSQLLAFFSQRVTTLPRGLTIRPSLNEGDLGGLDSAGGSSSGFGGPGSTGSAGRMSLAAGGGDYSADANLMDFVSKMGSSLFSLWKLVLLRKRILFVSQPPVGQSCQQVYLTWLLGLHSVELEESDASRARGPLRPLFYVSVSDIPSLQKESSFVACATERVLEDRSPPLYDACLKAGSMRYNSKALCAAIKVSSGDRRRFAELKKKLASTHMLGAAAAENETSCDGDQPITEQSVLMQCFLGINNRIFMLLKAAAKNESNTITRRELKSIGMHSSLDRKFIRELAAVYFPNLKVR